MYTPKGELNDSLLKLIQTEGVVEKFAEAKSPDECYEIAKEAGVELSKEEFVANMEIMKAYLEENEEGTLSDDDLDQIAGGKNNKAIEVTKNVLEITAPVVTIVTAAASAV